MGFLDFFKSKKSNNNDLMERMDASIFPKGQKDQNAVVDQLLIILNNSMSKDLAINIAVKTCAYSFLTEKFDIQDFKSHLERYCLDKFSETQFKQFYHYHLAIRSAKKFHNKTPSEIWRDGDYYYW